MRFFKCRGQAVDRGQVVENKVPKLSLNLSDKCLCLSFHVEIMHFLCQNQTFRQISKLLLKFN